MTDTTTRPPARPGTSLVPHGKALTRVGDPFPDTTGPARPAYMPGRAARAAGRHPGEGSLTGDTLEAMGPLGTLVALLVGAGTASVYVAAFAGVIPVVVPIVLTFLGGALVVVHRTQTTITDVPPGPAPTQRVRPGAAEYARARGVPAAGAPARVPSGAPVALPPGPPAPGLEGFFTAAADRQAARR